MLIRLHDQGDGDFAEGFVIVTAVNDLPTATNLTQTLKIAEDAGATLLFLDDPLVVDVDSPTVTATLRVDAAEGSLAGGSGLLNPTAGVYTISGTPQAVTTALAAVTFTPAASFSGSASVAVSITDGVSGTIPVTGTLSVVQLDTTGPVAPVIALLAGSDGLLAAGETATVTFTFLEAPTAFAVNDVTMTNGTLSNLVVSSNAPLVYTATLVAKGSGPVDVSVAAGVFTDAAGNANTQASNILSLTADVVAPTAEITLDNSVLAASETSVVTIEFSEAVDGFSLADLVATNGTLGDLSQEDDRNYTAIYTPSAGVAGAESAISLALSGVSDLAGNAGVGSVRSANVAVDTVRPLAPSLILEASSNSGSTGDTLTNNPAPVLLGMAEPGSSVTLFAGSIGLETVKADAATGAFSFSLTDLETGPATFTVVATDAAGNRSEASAPLTVTVDTAAPTVALAVADTTLDSTDPVSVVTFTFSEAVNGFGIEDVTAEGGLLSDLVQDVADPRIYTAIFTADPDFVGPGSVAVKEGSYADDAANAGTGRLVELTVSTDATGPTVVISTSTQALGGESTATVTFTFSEVPADFRESAVSVADGAGTISDLKVVEGSGGLIYNATFKPTAAFEGEAEISLAADCVTDAAGNGNAASNTVKIDFDTLDPTLDSTSPSDGATAVDGAANLTLVFSEAVQAGTGHFVLTNADDVNDSRTVDVTSSQVSFDGQTVIIDPGSPLQSGGTYYVTFTAGVVEDEAGNSAAALGAEARLSFTVADTIAPATPTLELWGESNSGSTLDTLTNDARPTLIGRAEPGSSVEVFGGSTSLGSATADDNGTFSFKPANALAEGELTLTAIAKDAAGNASQLSRSLTITIDTAPAAAPIIALDDTALSIGETSAVTITFAEAVLGFGEDDLQAAGGTLSALQATGDLTCAAIFKPTTDLESTGNLIVLDMSGVTDAAGNAGIGTAESERYAIDTKAPTLAMASSATSLNQDGTSRLTFTFSELPAKFTAEDVSVTPGAGAISEFSETADPLVYTAVFRPMAGYEGAAVISIGDGTYADAALNPGSGDSVVIGVDALAPTALSCSTATDADFIRATTALTLTFSEAVVAGNGSIVITAIDDPNEVHSIDVADKTQVTFDGETATLTPMGILASSGGYRITFAEGTIEDVAGNAAVAMTDLDALTFSVADTTAPAAPILEAASDAILAIGAQTVVTFTFDEAPKDFSAADVTVTNGELDQFAQDPANPLRYTATLSATANGPVSVSVASGTFKDGAGNANVASSNTLILTADLDAPTATISMSDGSLKVGETSNVTINFSEAVHGFDKDDLTASEGKLSDVSSSDGGKTWTAIFTPDAGVAKAANLITLDKTGVRDGAGNAGSGLEHSDGFAIDTALPTFAGSLPVDEGTDVPAGANLMLTFSEVVQAGAGVIVISNTSDADDRRSIAVTDQTQVTFDGMHVTINPADKLLAGASYTLTFEAGTIEDSAGNPADGMTEKSALRFTVVAESRSDGSTNDTTTGPDTLTGTTGSDTQSGGLGNDSVAAGAGSDNVFGNEGNDQVFGNEGADSVFGGKGDDRTFGGQGDDAVQGNLGNDSVEGNKGNDEVLGNQGSDTVLGNEGGDFVHGGQDNDFVHGGQGDDDVNGGLGNDTVNGGLGNDVLTGGAGADVFVFAAGSGNDVVTDFDFAQGDRLDFGGRAYSLDTAADSSVEIVFADGGVLILQGVSEDQFSAAFVA